MFFNCIDPMGISSAILYKNIPSSIVVTGVVPLQNVSKSVTYEPACFTRIYVVSLKILSTLPIF